MAQTYQKFTQFINDASKPKTRSDILLYRTLNVFVQRSRQLANVRLNEQGKLVKLPGRRRDEWTALPQDLADHRQ